MQPIALGQEQALVRRHRVLSGQQVLERRHLAAFGMTAPKGLLELLRITEQDQAPPRGGGGQHIAERHLAGLVDDQDVDALLETGTRPTPGRRAEHIDVSVFESRKDGLVPGLAHDPPLAFVRAFLTVDEGHGAPILTCLLRDGLQEIDDDLVADRGDADLESRAHERADDSRTGVGLAGAGRALNGQHVAVEGERDPTGRFDGRLSRLLQSAVGACRRGWSAQQQIHGGAIWPPE